MTARKIMAGCALAAGIGALHKAFRDAVYADFPEALAR